MSSPNVTNVTNVTSVTTVTNITNVTNVTNVTKINDINDVNDVNDVNEVSKGSGYNSCDTIKYPRVIYDPIYEKESQNILNELSECKCCKIHAINRPSIFEHWVEVLDRKNVPDRPSNTIINSIGESELICYCTCRINARMVCRNHPDYIP